MTKKQKSDKREKVKNGECEPKWREDKQCFELRFTYFDIDGNKKRKSFSAQSKYECEEKREVFLEELEKEKNGVAIHSTIPDILRIENERRLRNNKQHEQGYGRNEDTIKYIEKSSIGRIPIKDISVNQLDYFLFEITCYADDTIKKIYSKVRRSFKKAYDEDIIDENPFDNLKNELDRPKSQKQTKIITPLSIDDQKKFEEALMDYSKEKTKCNKYHRQLLIELYSGMRMGEINALTPNDVDFKKNIIYVSKTISRDRTKKPFISPRPKTDKSNREVPMLPIVREQLKSAIDDMYPNENNLIFCNKNNKGLLTTQQVNSAYRRICLNAGIDQKNIKGQHQLRHTFGTRCVEAKMDYKVLSDIMGHSDIHVTIDTYVSTLSTHRDANLQMVESYFDSL